LRIRQQGGRRADRVDFRRIVLRQLFGFQLCGVRPLMVSAGQSAAIRIGTRGSQLALWQAEWVASAIRRRHPEASVELVVIKTQGDKILDVPLAKVGGKGLFVKEIEEALLDGRIDLAVHSMKDVPADIPDGLTIGSIPRREDPRDVLISKRGHVLGDLPHAARIGTSSLRRAAQLLRLRPDVQIVPLRGNLDTRLRKLDTDAENLDAIVLAAAGVRRLGLAERVTEYLDSDRMLPAVAQGALGIELRCDDRRSAALTAFLDHVPTRAAVLGERAFLHRLGGSCQVPVAGYGRILEDRFDIIGLVAGLDGRELFRERLSGGAEAAEQVGVCLAEALLTRGADRILTELDAATGPHEPAE